MIEIPQEMIQKWQRIVDLICEIAQVPSVLITRAEARDLCVFVSSGTANNPFQHGKRSRRDTGIFCEEVMTSRRQLLVANSAKEKTWRSNPESRLGMISYLGLPITWPNGDIFGTICLLDNKSNSYSEILERLLLQCRDVIEDDLTSLSALDARLTREAQARLRESEKARAELQLALDGLKRSEQSEREAKLDLERVLAATPDYIWSVESDGQGRWNYRYYSRNVEQITGRPPEYYMAGPERWLATIHPDDVKLMRHICEQMMNADLEYSDQEYRIIHSDGSVRWVRDRVRLARLEEDRIRIDGVVSDLTERRQAQDLLRESEHRLSLIVQQLPAILWTTDRDLLITSSTGSGLEALGLRVNQTRGLSLYEYLQSNDPTFPPISSHLRALEGESVTMEQEWGGNIYQCQVEALRDRRGRIIGCIGVAVEITQRKRVEDALRESEKRARELFDSSPDAIFVEDLTGNVLDANPAACRLHGLTREELIGKNITELVPPDSRENARSNLPKQGREEVESITGHSLTKDGRSIPVEIKINRIDYAGQPALLSHVRDVSERRRAEDEHRRYEEQLQHTKKIESLAVLAGGIAHDFNNLITAMMGYTSVARTELPAGSPAAPLLDEADKAAQQAAELTRQMLAYSGQGRFVVQSCDLSRLVREMTRMIGTLISRRTVLRLELEPDLPPIVVDVAQIRQVISNLISNASDALGDEAGEIALRTGVRKVDQAFLRSTYLPAGELPEGEYVYLEVSDTGVGMSEETRARVFEPFFSTKFTGRGLGLAATLGIMRGHHGTIKVESAPGQGAIFQILFPIDRQIAATAKSLPPHGDWRGSGTILIVEDEKVVRSFVSMILQRAGFQVLVAGDGIEGVDVFAEHAGEIIAVLLDLTMPRMGGLEALAVMRRVKSDLPAILMSGFSTDDLVQEITGLKRICFIQKPFSINDLLDAIRQTIAAPA